MASDKIDKLASIELKGALIVPSIACRLNLPCIIVRKEDKAYGVTGRIAGADVAKGDRHPVFRRRHKRRLIQSRRRSNPCRSSAAVVKHLLVVVNREQGGKENLEKLGFKVHALAKVSELVDSLCGNKHISNAQAR